MSEQKGSFGIQGTGDTSGYGGLVRSSFSPTSAQKPYGSYFDEVTDELERAFPEFNDAIEKVVVVHLQNPKNHHRQNLCQPQNKAQLIPIRLRLFSKLLWM